ncbi:MAG: DUF1007 family protein [Spirochaetales bacterium]|nr:DUF1007 family protein [Spirochaetales bacterium]
MKYLKILLLGFILSASLYAHPHLFISTACTLEFEEGQIKGLWVEFEFDEYFSSEINLKYDADGDGIYNEGETAEVYNNAFINLQYYNYFTFIRHEEEVIYPEITEKFSVRCEGKDKIIYDFFIPLPSYPYKDIYIALYDATFFCSCEFQEEYFSVTGTGIPEYSQSKAVNDNLSIHYNPQAGTEDIGTSQDWSLGLLTYIPEEIHIQF